MSAVAGDPTYGQIDPDIQRAVDETQPRTLGQRVAMENTLQRRRDAWADNATTNPYAVYRVPGPADAACAHTDRDVLWLVAVGLAFIVGFAAGAAVWAL